MIIPRFAFAKLLGLFLLMFASQIVSAADVAGAVIDRLSVAGVTRRDDPAGALQLRLKEKIAKGLSIDAYPVALAQAWLEYARESYFRKDALAAKQAMQEAKTIIATLDIQGPESKVDARVISSSSRLRNDLWTRAATNKQHAEFHCATWQTAHMEIALIAAGRANNDMGWRAARPFIQRAERYAGEADRKLVACAAPQPQVSQMAPPVRETTTETTDKMTPAQAAKTIDPTPKQSLPDGVHFSRESAELSDVSALVLEQVSYVMRANPAIVLELRGGAYELASVEENGKLALARAQGVKEYLIDTGIGKERLMVKPVSTVATESLSALERAKLRCVELVQTQSEVVPVESQDKDLSAEGP